MYNCYLMLISTARIKPLRPSEDSNNQKKVKSFKSAAKLVLNQDRNNVCNIQNITTDNDNKKVEKNMANKDEIDEAPCAPNDDAVVITQSTSLKKNIYLNKNTSIVNNHNDIVNNNNNIASNSNNNVNNSNNINNSNNDNSNTGSANQVNFEAKEINFKSNIVNGKEKSDDYYKNIRKNKIGDYLSMLDECLRLIEKF